MKGDFTRFTFDPTKHYRRVLMQQGRVQLDADWNEQAAINRHLESLYLRDILGEIAVIPGKDYPQPFKIHLDENQELAVHPGRIYLSGFLCELHRTATIASQPWPTEEALPSEDGHYLVLLEGWEQHVTWQDDPEIREIALNGPDTATRSQAIWQIRFASLQENPEGPLCLRKSAEWQKLNSALANRGRLAARAEPSETTQSPCIVPPGAGYRSLQNQLYRVEIHTGGPLNDATFKWSRDNGSVVTRWTGVNENDPDELFVESTGKDDVLRFLPGGWVELIDASHPLQHQPGTLVQLTEAKRHSVVIDPSTATGTVDFADFEKPILRRWESAGAERVKIASTSDGFLPLEEGVEIRFAASEKEEFRAGDYWLIPARTTSGEVEWPTKAGSPASLPPHGIERHLAPLAHLEIDGGKPKIHDLREEAVSLTQQTMLQRVGGDGQQGMPGETLKYPILAGVSRGGNPVAGAFLQFTSEEFGFVLTTANGEEVSDEGALIIRADDEGIAGCEVQLKEGVNASSGQVRVELLDLCMRPLHLAQRFTVTVSRADQVWFDESRCADLLPNDAAPTVQNALEALCQRETGGGCSVTVGDGGKFPNLEAAFDSAANEELTSMNICLLPGFHLLPANYVSPQLNWVKITGAGPSTTIRLEGNAEWSIRYLTMRDVAFGFGVQDGSRFILRTTRGYVENCFFKRLVENADVSIQPMITIAPVGKQPESTIHWIGNVMEDAIRFEADNPLADATGLDSAVSSPMATLIQTDPQAAPDDYEAALTAATDAIFSMPVASRRDWQTQATSMHLLQPGSGFSPTMETVSPEAATANPYKLFFETITAGNTSKAKIRTALESLPTQQSELRPGIPLALDSPSVGGEIRGSQIIGLLLVNLQMDEELDQQWGDDLLTRPASPHASLTILDNRIEAIRTRISSNPTYGCHRAVVISGNRFMEARSTFLGYTVALSNNHFLQNNPVAAHLLAQRTTITGNLATGDNATIHRFAHQHEEAANAVLISS